MKKLNDVLKELIKGKRILVLGFGREGSSTLKRILEIGGFETVSVADARDVSASLPEGVSFVEPERYLDCLNDYDVVFKSPGVVLKQSPEAYKALITSETEVFMQAYRDKIIGITGTKGKSTTSSFIYYVLSESGKNVLFAGNIGIPVFEIADDVAKDTIVVLELSCHQLEYAKTAPHVGVLLNVYEDHLDHYGTRERYGLAKKNIYKYQKKEDLLYTLKEVISEWGEAESKTVFIDKSMSPVKSLDSLSHTNFRGEHNLLNIAFAYNVCKEFGVEDECFIQAVMNFKTLPHRLEPAGNIDGVDYYDDSISTTVKSTISAVESIKNAALLLVGGMERNLVYDELISYVAKSHLKYLICMYDSGKRIFDLYEKCPEKTDKSPVAVLVKDLSAGVLEAKKLAATGDAVLLSPAAASYGYFKNFEERGDVFKELIKKS